MKTLRSVPSVFILTVVFSLFLSGCAEITTALVTPVVVVAEMAVASQKFLEDAVENAPLLTAGVMLAAQQAGTPSTALVVTGRRGRLKEVPIIKSSKKVAAIVALHLIMNHDDIF